MTSTPHSGSSTPNPNTSRFTSQAADAEDRLKADTVGLVTLNDFRKRRAEALADGNSAPGSGTVTPVGREPLSNSTQNNNDDNNKSAAFKKRKKTAVKRGGGLSFGDDQDNEDANEQLASRSATPATDSEAPLSEGSRTPAAASFKKKALRPNASISLQPKTLTKSALLKEAQLKDQLKKEYTQIQEAVKATEFVLPFVFYDGKNTPGGMCRMKKGDHIWLFVERARKVGAEKADKSRKDWARISVDDLMVVKGDLIIPHHYDFHYFLINKAVGYHGLIFPFSAQPTAATPQHLLAADAAQGSRTATPDRADNDSHLQTAAQRKQQAAVQSGPPDSELEGFDHDPNATRVVDRRWYERNKHIYPASSWEEFDATRDYSSGVKKDKDGNAMFFSR